MGDGMLTLDTPKIDLNRLVSWNPCSYRTRYRVASGDKRAGQAGVILGTIALRHASGYEVVLQLDSGKIGSFAPLALHPIVAPEVGEG